MRVGWIRAERALIQRLARALNAGDLGTPVLEQLIVADLLSDYDAILETRREQLLASREHLERSLAAALPQWTVPHVDGGITTWVNLGEPVSSQLALAARSRGLLVTAGPRFGLDGTFERFLRLPIGYPPEQADRALAALAAAWSTLSVVAGMNQELLTSVV